MIGLSRSWACLAVAFGPIRRSRRAMRWMWVSTGKTDLPNANRSVQWAVFGPTPVKVSRCARAASSFEIGEMLQVDAAAVGADLAEDCLDAGGLQVAQAAD